MKILYGIIFLFMFVPIHLFAAYPGTTQNAGAIVAIEPEKNEIDKAVPHFFEFLTSRDMVWYTYPKKLTSDRPIISTGCPKYPNKPVVNCPVKLNALGAITVNSEPYLALQEDNGQVWVNSRNSAKKKWAWINVGCLLKTKRGKCKKINQLSAVSMRDDFDAPQRPYFFMANKKGKVVNLWRNSKKEWNWADLKCPGSKCNKDLKRVGAVAMFDHAGTTERPWLFVFDDNEKKLWLLFWNIAANPQQWSWFDMGCPTNNCDKNKKYIGIGAAMRIWMRDSSDLGEPRLPYVFLAEQDNPNKIHYRRWTINEKENLVLLEWDQINLTNTLQIIGVVPVYSPRNNTDNVGVIIPVIVSETKDKKIVTTYLDGYTHKNGDNNWKTKSHDCSLCPHYNAVAISRTHIKDKKGGAGVIVFEQTKDLKKEKFNTYRF